MRHLRFIILAIALSIVVPATANEIMLENFESRPETRWHFFTDTVMGGVSSGRVAILEEDSKPFARMTGDVSTANNGGFIQMRLELPEAPSPDATGVRLVVRGNNQRYFVHLRTRGMLMPWQYYQAGFDVSGDWAEIRLAFADFKPSGRLLRETPRPTSIKSIGIVAYGRDHRAQIDVSEVGLY